MYLEIINFYESINFMWKYFTLYKIFELKFCEYILIQCFIILFYYIYFYSVIIMYVCVSVIILLFTLFNTNGLAPNRPDAT